MMRKLVCGVFAYLCLVGAPFAATFEGKVIGVTDGDTVSLLDQEKKQHKIRMLGIDAPESSQDYGQKSKQSLSELVFGKQVTAGCQKADKYGRDLCKIVLNEADINLEQVRRGMAWHYKQYMSDQDASDRAQYSNAQEAAQKAKIGLWAASAPTPPWDFRRVGRNDQAPSAPQSFVSRDVQDRSADEPSISAPPVKMSRSGICHAPGSTYYSRTKHYTAYRTFDACVAAGGRAPLR